MHIDCTDPVIGLWRHVLGGQPSSGQSEIKQGQGQDNELLQMEAAAHLAESYLFRFDEDTRRHQGASEQTHEMLCDLDANTVQQIDVR